MLGVIMTDSTYSYEKAKRVYAEYKSSQELQRKIATKTVVSVVLTFLWYVLWTTSALRYFSHSWTTFNHKNPVTYVAIIVIVLVPFYLFKPQKWLRFKPYAGKIMSAEARNIRVDRATSTHILHLSTISFDGKNIKKLKVKMFPGIENYYRAGKHFVYLRGIEYPIRLDLTDEELQSEQTLCHFCGHFNPKRYDRCFNCTSILWSKELG